VLRRLALLTILAALAGAAPAHAGDPGDWVAPALADQYELGSTLPLRDAPWIGTHNSFNSPAEMGPALSAQDSNQRIRLVDQLDAGIRSLELDVHWFPSVTAGGFAPVVCHATGEHAGCTIEKPLAVVLDDIAGWLREHPDQVLLLYLEDHLDSPAGYDAAAAVVDQKLGGVLYRPRGGGCVPLPLDDTRAAVRAAGAQVIVVSDCGQGAAWPAVAFDWSDTHEEERPRGYEDFPGCGPDFTRAQYDATLIRYFEDSTRLTNTAATTGAASRDDGITVETAGAMARCGVDLLGLDQVERDDPRFAALVWSWAPGQPARRGCAAQFDGRWYALRCTRRLRPACLTADGRWRVPSRVVRFRDAAAQCRRRAAVFAVPRTGYETQQLRVAMERVGARRAWLAHRSG
jgi:hypothetical protein